ncbi:hypothetical protein [Deinococcus kurensis]|uniref:hypothetical protein n=1 Tax=Deinococcus kurensis TaxID=2662757 RepID=UPI0012D2AFCF|nr:hypothetical protein [Deinococcus kurensis]
MVTSLGVGLPFQPPLGEPEALCTALVELTDLEARLLGRHVPRVFSALLVGQTYVPLFQTDVDLVDAARLSLHSGVTVRYRNPTALPAAQRLDCWRDDGDARFRLTLLSGRELIVTVTADQRYTRDGCGGLRFAPLAYQAAYLQARLEDAHA